MVGRDPKSTSAGKKMGGYVRWKQDDEADAAKRYTANYLYDASKDKDLGIGEPLSIRFKFQTEVIPPTSPAGRSQIQIHPDGKKDGTAGCIGIQTYGDCEAVAATLRNYHALKLKVDIQ